MAREIVKNQVIQPEQSFETVSPYLDSKIKRVADVGLAVIGLLLISIIFPFVAVLIKLDSRGSILYRQTRLGMNGRSFLVVKFRTMVQDAEVNGNAVWAVENDPRVTRVGRVLRNLYIDELPQWWNVIRGDMSAVGPRPERPEFIGTISNSVRQFSTRLAAKPGITGLAQVNYKYGSNVRDARNKFRFDKLYNENATFVLDIKIIARTFQRILMSRGT